MGVMRHHTYSLSITIVMQPLPSRQLDLFSALIIIASFTVTMLHLKASLYQVWLHCHLKYSINLASTRGYTCITADLQENSIIAACKIITYPTTLDSEASSLNIIKPSGIRGALLEKDFDNLVN